MDLQALKLLKLLINITERVFFLDNPFKLS